MKLLKRPIMWGLGLAALVFIGLAAYAYFVGTRALLNHAEAFSFRRMNVAQLADQGAFRFFYVTNRRQGSMGGSLEERFEPEREEALKFGFFDTRNLAAPSEVQSLLYIPASPCFRMAG